MNNTSRLTSINEFVNDHITSEVIDMNNEKCVKCNSCCSMETVLSKKDYKRIEKFITTTDSGIAVYKRGLKVVKDHLEKGILYMLCPFSGEHSKKCSIYKIRPEVCRKFHCSPNINLVKERPLKAEYTIMDFFVNRDSYKKIIKEMYKNRGVSNG